MKNTIISKIKSKYCAEAILDYFDYNFKLKLFRYSKAFQKKYGITIKDYKLKYIEKLAKLKNEKEFLEKIKSFDVLHLIKIKPKNFFLFNSIKCFYDSKDSFRGRIRSEIRGLEGNYFGNEGFQIYGIIENKLIGAIEGPPKTSYENGFFIFEIIIDEDYPFQFGKFYIKTKIFHPNIGEDGLVSLDIFGKEWTLSLTFRTCVLSVQSLLDSPNPYNYLNEKAAQLYKENKYQYEKTVKYYVKKYANFLVFEDELKKYKLNIEHFEI